MHTTKIRKHAIVENGRMPSQVPQSFQPDCSSVSPSDGMRTVASRLTNEGPFSMTFRHNHDSLLLVIKYGIMVFCLTVSREAVSVQAKHH
jgi:hypothetical protein